MIAPIKLLLVCCLVISLSAAFNKATHYETSSESESEEHLLAAGKICYGAIFDAGSSGTRLYVYSWPCRGFVSLPSLSPKTVFSEKLTPGISTFPKDPNGLKVYLNSLINKMKAVIPKAAHSETPIMLAATAGMRLLTVADQTIVLNTVKSVLGSSGFVFKGGNWAQVITGQEEGIYLWISVNYLLGNIKNNKQIASSQTTVTTIDLGGASTQIAFKPSNNAFSPNNYHVDLPQNNDYTVYSVTYLGYGVDQARFSAQKLANTGLPYSYSGCFNYGYSGLSQDQKTTIYGTSNPYACLRQIRKNFGITKKTIASDSNTFSINNSVQPKVPKNQRIIAVSAINFAVRGLGLPAKFYAKDLLKAATDFCAKPLSIVLAKNPKDTYIYNQCFLGLYASSLLIDAYQVGDALIESPNDINGAEPSWAMGFLFNAVTKYNCDDRSVSACTLLKNIFESFDLNM